MRFYPQNETLKGFLSWEDLYGTPRAVKEGRLAPGRRLAPRPDIQGGLKGQATTAFGPRYLVGPAQGLERLWSNRLGWEVLISIIAATEAAIEVW